MGTGTKWDNAFASKGEFEATSMRYSLQSSSVNAETSKDFLQRFNALKFNLVHFTPAEVDRDGVATFYSRHKAGSKGLVNNMNENNTTAIDLEQLRTDQFSFFSLEVEGASSKNASRFTPLDGFKYTMPMNAAMDSPYFSSSYGVINDTLKFYEHWSPEMSVF
ncbi:hypothetical protein ACSN7O_004735 [Enterobacter chuandaensis]